jgi:hypothetical protein
VVRALTLCSAWKSTEERSELRVTQKFGRRCAACPVDNALAVQIVLTSYVEGRIENATSKSPNLSDQGTIIAGSKT